MPEFNGVSHIDLTVRDPDRSAAWYEQVLDMRRIAEHSADEAATAGVARVVNLMHRSGLVLGLNRHQSGNDEEFSEVQVGLNHLSLAVASRDELENWVEHLDACGVQHSGISDPLYSGISDSWSTQCLCFATLTTSNWN